MCDRVNCDRPVEVFVGWLSAAARPIDDVDCDLILFPVDEETETKRRSAAEARDRSWFKGCTDCAREVWREQLKRGAAPVFRKRGQR